MPQIVTPRIGRLRRRVRDCSGPAPWRATRPRERDQLYGQLFDAAPTGLVLVDPCTRRYLLFNDAVCKAAGYTRGELARLRIEDLADAPLALIETRLRRIVTEGSLSFEMTLKCKDGTRRHMLLSMRRVTVRGRIYVTGAWLDVTAGSAAAREAGRVGDAPLEIETQAQLEQANRLLAEQALALQAAHGELKAVFDTAALGIALVSRHVFVRVNRAFELILGWDAGELDGRSTRELFLTDEDFIAATKISAFTQGEGPLRGAPRLATKDGRLIWCRGSLARFEGRDGQDMLLMVLEDVSDEHAAADALRVAKEAADSANRAKSVFLANMSHEIRTPMNAIIGLTHQLKRDAPSDYDKRQLDKIAGAALHLLTLLKDILDFSKIEAGKLELDPTDFSVERVVASVFALAAQRAEAQGLEMIADIADVPSTLHGDAARLGQVLLNFVGNAVKFTPQGSVTLVARVAERGAAGAPLRLRFEVRDTGVGIAPDQLDQVFEAFNQGDVSTTRTHGGSGLGLAICRRLAALMGGAVGVDSVEGQGSRFWFEAPFGVAAAAAAPRPGGLPAGLRALVVDDAPAARRLLAELLVRLGARADAVATGEEALARIAAADADGDPYRLVFADWEMPGVAGSEIGRRVRRLGLRLPPLCILLGGSSGCTREEIESGGFAAFIAKPVMPALLGETLERVFGAAPQDEGCGAPAPLGFAPGKRLLLAEDNPLNQEVAVNLLQDLGFSVDLAEDGLQALESARSQRYDLILMDLQMPRMDGLEATRRIRELPRMERVPILAMTANAFADDRAAALAAGMNDHVVKPVDPEALVATLARWLPDAERVVRAPPPPVVDAGHDELQRRFAEVAGLRLEGGLQTLGGDGSRLRSMLLRFGADHGRDAELARQEIERGDHGAALRRLHTLGGVAAMLGLVDVQLQALRSEQALRALQREGGAPSALGLEPLAEVLASCAEVVQSLRPDTGAGPARAGEFDDLRARVGELLQLLRTDNLEAVDCHARLRPALRALGDAAAQRLERRIDEFDFEGAAREIEAWLATAP
ncbi:MAG: response regulator, partial [Burkholderiales bacterium]|nr:response regulator [Burkholderiales bacterium]